MVGVVWIVATRGSELGFEGLFLLGLVRFPIAVTFYKTDNFSPEFSPTWAAQTPDWAALLRPCRKSTPQFFCARLAP